MSIAVSAGRLHRGRVDRVIALRGLGLDASIFIADFDIARAAVGPLRRRAHQELECVSE